VVVGNIEFDHADLYDDLDAVRLSFRRLVNLIPERGLLLVGADSPDALALKGLARCPVETFGLSEEADWQGAGLSFEAGATTFKVRRQGRFFGSFAVPALGAHNVRNALAAIAIGTAVGVTPAKLAEGLRRFRGVRRRLEALKTVSGVTVFDDFAHHPTAVGETLAALRLAHPEARIWAVFEPRSASSCRRVFQKQFARAFEKADEIVLAPIYRSSLPEAERLSVDELVTDLQAAGKHARHITDIDVIVKTIVAEHRPGDLVVLMSNGGFGGIHGKLLHALEG
jgi:UDP-N-acetylmuramate: L-alanyl-gamma-D-glutamyl-meso-diaminopimelate ligase